jgi:hypothetical protein
MILHVYFLLRYAICNIKTQDVSSKEDSTMRREKASLKGQDVLLLLKLLTNEGKSQRMVELAYELGISQSEISQGLERLRVAHLVDSEKKLPLRGAAFELIVYGLKYFFPVSPGPLVSGIPTAHSTKPLSEIIVSNEQEKYVWPDGEGEVRGQAIEPLYHSVPKAVKHDKKLYELLAIVDSLRFGRAREQKIAKEELKKRILTPNKEELRRARQAEVR